MQKIFIKYIAVVMTMLIIAISVVHFFATKKDLREQQLATFHTKIEQVIHTMKNNEEELAEISANLDEDYLTRAKAAAYVMERNQDILGKVSELKDLAKLLNVDELHVIDGKGVIVYSSVPKYLGLDFHDDDQTREFLSIIEGDKEYLVQDAQPNAAEGKMMKYVGVARKSGKGIIQVGLEAKRLSQAQERNTYNYIFSRFPTDIGEEFFAIGHYSKTILGCSNSSQLGKIRESYSLDNIPRGEEGGFLITKEGEERFVATKEYKGVLIGASIPKDIMYGDLLSNMVHMVLYLIGIEIMVLVFLFLLLKYKVVEGIHSILKDLSGITNGNMDITLTQGGNPEFEELSDGINTMVGSIVAMSNRVSKIIKVSGIPLAAFEYHTDKNFIYVTSGLKELLGISAEEMELIHNDVKRFSEKIQSIMSKPIEGETDIFEIAEGKYVKIHMSNGEQGDLGVVSDATKEVLEKHRMQYENNHDQLTGLPRYSYFQKCVKEIQSRMKEDDLGACVMMDMDKFKNINDTYGHDNGDRYLQGFAQILMQLPKEHYLVCRRSGDEFCMMLYGFEHCEEMLYQLEEFWQRLSDSRIEISKGEEITYSVSGGYTWVTEDEDMLENYLRWADVALYEVKKTNKGHFGGYNDIGK